MCISINKKLLKLILPSGVKNTPKTAIFRMCYGENGTVKFLETLADNVWDALRYHPGIKSLTKKILTIKGLRFTQLD
jgi:hypothetical protein